MPVLKLLNKKEIKKVFDKNSFLVIEYLLRKVLFSQPEMLPKQERHNIQITKEFLEQWIAQALGWRIVGSGNYPIDVYSKKLKIGADVKFISATVDKNNNFTNGQSNETSLGQNFKDIGKKLDQCFAEKNFNKVLRGWKRILVKKMNKPIQDYGLKTIYYFIFIRGGNSISLAVAKINPSKIKNIKISKKTESSAFIQGFIKSDYGNVKIYKSKKRMELRCFPKKLQEKRLLIRWEFKNLDSENGVELRKLILNKKKFNKHSQKEIRRFLNF